MFIPKILVTILFISLIIGGIILVVADSNATEELGITVMVLGNVPITLAILWKCFYEIWRM